MFYLGVCYEHGNGVVQDLTQALQWYEKAAHLGHEVAMYNLAFSYHNGDGVPQDYEKMRFWLVKAAKLGDAASQRDLGWCYHEGIGIPLDRAAAVRWYRAAAVQGYRKAKARLRRLDAAHLDAAYREMAQDTVREAEALEWAEGTLMTEEELNAL